MGSVVWADERRIGVEKTRDKRLTLEYWGSTNEAKPEPVRELVDLVFVPRHFGGEMVYTHHPHCSCWAMMLCQRGMRFLCRRRHSLIYVTTLGVSMRLLI